jgi:membrane protease YdiL (CAAX protease family)
VATVVLFEAGLLVLAFGLGWLTGNPPFQFFRFGWPVVVVGVFASVPPLLLLLWCVNSRWQPFVRLMSEVEENILPLFEECTTFDFALISIIAGVAEEALFRGVIQMSVSSVLTPFGALVSTALLFGLLHLITPAYAIIAALIGFFLGWLLMLSGNLLLPIVVHTLYDFLALTYVARRSRAKMSQ